MSSFVMTKSEAAVLFDLLGMPAIPTGIQNFKEVDADEYQRIAASFMDSKLIDKESKAFRPDKGLERFLLPVIKAEAIMIFNYGSGSICKFNASLYFAKGGVVALIDDNDAIKFLLLALIDDLLLFTDVNMIDNISMEGAEPYISYVLLDRGSSIVHCTRIDPEKGFARIAEGKRTKDAPPLEATGETGISEYREMLHGKLREVYNAACC